MSNHADSSWEIVIDVDASSYFLGKFTIRSRHAYISYPIMQFIKTKADQWHAWKAKNKKALTASLSDRTFIMKRCQ